MMKLEGVDASQIEAALHELIHKGKLQLQGHLEATGGSGFMYSRS